MHGVAAFWAAPRMRSGARFCVRDGAVGRAVVAAVCGHLARAAAWPGGVFGGVVGGWRGGWRRARRHPGHFIHMRGVFCMRARVWRKMRSTPCRRPKRARSRAHQPASRRMYAGALSRRGARQASVRSARPRGEQIPEEAARTRVCRWRSQVVARGCPLFLPHSQATTVPSAGPRAPVCAWCVFPPRYRGSCAGRHRVAASPLRLHTPAHGVSSRLRAAAPVCRDNHITVALHVHAECYTALAPREASRRSRGSLRECLPAHTPTPLLHYPFASDLSACPTSRRGAWCPGVECACLSTRGRNHVSPWPEATWTLTPAQGWCPPRTARWLAERSALCAITVTVCCETGRMPFERPRQGVHKPCTGRLSLSRPLHNQAQPALQGVHAAGSRSRSASRHRTTPSLATRPHTAVYAAAPCLPGNLRATTPPHRTQEGRSTLRRPAALRTPRCRAGVYDSPGGHERIGAHLRTYLHLYGSTGWMSHGTLCGRACANRVVEAIDDVRAVRPRLRLDGHAVLDELGQHRGALGAARGLHVGHEPQLRHPANTEGGVQHASRAQPIVLNRARSRRPGGVQKMQGKWGQREGDIFIFIFSRTCAGASPSPRGRARRCRARAPT